MPNVNSYPGLGERGLWAKHTLNLQTPMRLVYKFIQLSASTVIIQVEINQMKQKTAETHPRMAATSPDSLKIKIIDNSKYMIR